MQLDRHYNESAQAAQVIDEESKEPESYGSEEEKKEEEYVFKPSNLTLKAQKLPIPPLNLKRKNHFKPENECMGKVNSDSSEQKNQ